MTQIWIGPVKHYTAGRDLLLKARQGRRYLCRQPTTWSACRVLMSRGIVGLFETPKPGADYPCMTGDTEKAAGLTVCEPDNGVVQFARWRTLDQNAVSRSAVLVPAREDDGIGSVVICQS